MKDFVVVGVWAQDTPVAVASIEGEARTWSGSSTEEFMDRFPMGTWVEIVSAADETQAQQEAERLMREADEEAQAALS